MVNFYLSNTMSNSSKEMLEAINKNKTTGRHILIVPDRFTLSTEYNITKLIGSSMNVEVLTFSRLAIRVLEGKIKNCLSPEGAVMLLAKTVDKYSDKLLCYSKMGSVKGFVNELYAGISAIRNSGITVEKFEAALSTLKGYVKEKTNDILTLYNGYLKELQDNFFDSTTRLEALTKAIGDSEFCASSEFYISDFYAFTGKQYDIIQELMAHAKAVNIGVIANIGGDNHRIYPKNVRNRLNAIASNLGLKVQNISVFESLTKEKQAIERNIFGYGKEKCKNEGYVTLYSAKSIEEEAEFIADCITQNIRSGNYRYRDFGIVCSDILSYAPILNKVLSRYEIPFFWDQRTPLTDEPLVKQLLNCIRIIINDFSRNTVMEYAKNYFSGIDSLDNFENYCKKYNIEYSRFLSPFTIGAEEELLIAEEIRENIVKSIIPLPSQAKITDYIQLIKNFTLLNNFDEKLQKFADKQTNSNYNEGVRRSAQVPVKLKNVFEQFDELMGEDVKTLEQFYDLFKAGLESVTVALIPQSADCVYIGEAEDSRYDDKKILFIAGAVEGKFPYDTTDEGIIGKREYAAWKSADIEITPTAKEKNIYAKFYAEQLLVKPSNKLYVGYSLFDAKGAKNNHSLVINQLENLFDTKIKPVEVMISGKAFTYQNGYKKMLNKIKDINYSIRNEENINFVETFYSLLSKTEKEILDNIIFEADESLQSGTDVFFNSKHTSISQLECYFGCPYLHFICYGLRAKETDTGEIVARETGTVIHDMLEKYFRQTKNFNIDEKLIIRKVNDIIDELFEQPRFKSMLQSANAVQLERLRRECVILVKDLTALQKRSDFVPSEFEVNFGKGGAYGGINFADGKIELVGKIDRIDKYRNEVAVIDYKTGKVDADLKYVYYGKKIQLYIYLYALRKAGMIPAAALFLPLKAEYKKPNKADSRCRYNGQIINEENILVAFDRYIMEEGDSPIIPVEYNEKKGFSASKNVLLSREDMDNIIDYTIKLAEKAISEIISGNILPNPIKNECRFCPAKNFCGYDSVSSKGRDDSTINLSDFEVNND